MLKKNKLKEKKDKKKEKKIKGLFGLGDERFLFKQGPKPGDPNSDACAPFKSWVP